MYPYRSTLLSAIALAVVAAPPIQARSVRLAEVLAYRVVEFEGAAALQRGLLSALDEFTPFDPTPFPPPGTIPPEAHGHYLIPAAIWFGYDVLGPESLADFSFHLSPVMIGTEGYFVIAAAHDPLAATGSLVNLSSRAELVAGGDPLIGGFVITERSRRVLIRGVGPSLADLGVSHPLPDPRIALHGPADTVARASNDDWGKQDNASAIETAAATVGAFSLARDTRDAALLVQLPPGAYTVHLDAKDAASGVALLEIYEVPRTPP